LRNQCPSFRFEVKHYFQGRRFSDFRKPSNPQIRHPFPICLDFNHGGGIAQHDRPLGADLDDVTRQIFQGRIISGRDAVAAEDVEAGMPPSP